MLLSRPRVSRMEQPLLPCHTSPCTIWPYKRRDDGKTDVWRGTLNLRRMRAWLVRLWGMLRREPWRAELDAELRSHLALHIEDHIRAGMSPEEANRRARLRLGNIASATEQYRARKVIPSIADVARDLRYAVRSLAHAKGYSVAVIATLALCVGANATVLSALYGLVLRPRPVDDPERLVQLFNLREARNPDNPYSESSWIQYLDLRSRSDLFEGVALRTPAHRVVRLGTAAGRVTGQKATVEFFDLMGATPVVGRFFRPEEVDPGPGDVVVLSQTWWETDFGADPDVVGRDIVLDDGDTYTIIGVAPRSLEVFDYEARFTVPYNVTPRERDPAGGRYNTHGDDLWLRLKPGIGRVDALDQVRAIERGWFDDIAGAEGRRVYQAYDGRVEFDLPHRLTGSLYLAEGGALFILLTGCFNVMILVLGRVHQKRHELAIRCAVGAGLSALRRLIVVESALLAGAAALAGMTMAWGGVLAVNRYVAVVSPQTMPIDLNATVAVATLVIAVGLVCVMNLLPLELLSRAGALQWVGGGQQTSTASAISVKVSNGLIVGQVAVAFALLVGAGLLLNSFRHVLGVDPGFDVNRVVEGRLDFTTVQTFYPSRTEAAGFKRRIVDAMSEIPGVDHVGLSMFPMFAHDLRSGVIAGGTTATASTAHLVHFVSPEFFAAMGIPILEGRACRVTDGPHFVVVDELFAKRSFGGRRPVGLQVPADPASATGQPKDIVIGVAGRANLRGLEQRDGQSILYICEPVDSGWWEYSILLRTSRPADRVVAEMQARLRSIDPRVPLSYTGSLRDELDDMLLGRKAITMLLAWCAGLALLLSLLGIYAVLAHRVGQRRREIGIRFALGASRLEVYRLIVADGLVKTVIGLCLGVGGAVVLSRSLERFLFDVTASDPLAYIGAIGVFLIVAVAASMLPARRTLRFDPAESLRAE